MMKLNASLAGLTLLLASTITPTTTALPAATSEELRDAYPDLESTRAGNPLILCPFVRMLERSGRFDETNDGDQEKIINNLVFKKAADEFGCDSATACGPVISTVSAGQKFTGGDFVDWINPFKSVDLERLWDAPPISHDCGFTFEKGEGDEGVSATRLASTFARLAARVDSEGHLEFSDLLSVKNDICDEEDVDITIFGEIETRLIFAYLGGVERGYVEYSDVEGFLQVDTLMPQTKAEKSITAFYLYSF